MRNYLKRWRNMRRYKAYPHELTAVVRVALDERLRNSGSPVMKKAVRRLRIPRWSVLLLQALQVAAVLSPGVGGITCWRRRKRRFLAEMLGAAGITSVNHKRYVHYCPAFAAQFTAAGGASSNLSFDNRHIRATATIDENTRNGWCCSSRRFRPQAARVAG